METLHQTRSDLTCKKTPELSGSKLVPDLREDLTVALKTQHITVCDTLVQSSKTLQQTEHYTSLLVDNTSN